MPYLKPDRPLDILKHMIDHDQVELLDHIRAVVPGSTLAKAIGMNYQTFIHKLKHPEELKMEEINKLAVLIGIHPRLLTEIIFRQMEG